MRIVLDGLRGEDSITELSWREGTARLTIACAMELASLRLAISEACLKGDRETANRLEAILKTLTTPSKRMAVPRRLEKVRSSIRETRA